MVKARIPDLERKSVKSLYWNQYAVINRYDGKSTVERSVLDVQSDKDASYLQYCSISTVNT